MKRSRPSAPRRLMPPPTAVVRMPSDLLDLDQRAGEVFRVQKQHRLAVSADFRVPVPENARALGLELVASSDDVLDLVAEVVHPAVRIALEKFGDRRVGAERCKSSIFVLGSSTKMTVTP